LFALNDADATSEKVGFALTSVVQLTKTEVHYVETLACVT